MIYGLYSIRDTKTGFMTPVMEVNDEAAVRNFFHAVQNSDGILYSFSQDFTLFKVGSFDSESGAVLPFTPIIHVAEGYEAVRAMQKEESK